MFNKYTKALISLSCQIIKNAKSGHTGMAISSSPINFALFTKHINISNCDPKWFNRDRFVLSAGHGSANLYSLFYFSGLLSLEDIKQFRKGNNNVAGHPEYSLNNYIDASTGPLGQGVANAVGMAIAEKYLNNKWKILNGLVDHYTYVLVGDGDLQEGICYEAMSLAGKLKLNKLIMIHDSNDFQLDSSVIDVNIEDIKLRVESQGWNYLSTDNNEENISFCIEKAKSSNKPSFIEVKTIIGEGTSKQATNEAHGLSITNDEMNNINSYFDINHDNFNFEQEIFDFFRQNIIDRGNSKYSEWQNLIEKYKELYPELMNDFLSISKNQFEDFSKYLDLDDLNVFDAPTKTYLKYFFDQLSSANIKDVITLSADLASTTNCKLSFNNSNFNNDINSPYIMVGIREFAMGAIQNGILLHGGLRCFAGTFLAFSDYMKPAIRLGAMSKLPSSYIFTHDSYYVGNDGPTHQPYDQIPMLRAIDNVYVWRPCDEKELCAAFCIALNESIRTNCLVLTRQPIPSQINSSISNSYKGAYIISDCDNPDICLIANGSEVSLAMDVKESLSDFFNINAKVVSCPCLKEFLNQEPDYIRKTLDSDLGVVSIEASSDNYWYKLLKYCKKIITIQANHFGYSDDGVKVYSSLGFNKDNIIEIIKKELINV